jgi:hypothetical protein
MQMPVSSCEKDPCCAAQVNHETFHRILEEYRESKRRELDLELKAKQ